MKAKKSEQIVKPNWRRWNRSVDGRKARARRNMRLPSPSWFFFLFLKNRTIHTIYTPTNGVVQNAIILVTRCCIQLPALQILLHSFVLVVVSHSHSHSPRSRSVSFRIFFVLVTYILLFLFFPLILYFLYVYTKILLSIIATPHYVYVAVCPHTQSSSYGSSFMHTQTQTQTYRHTHCFICSFVCSLACLLTRSLCLSFVRFFDSNILFCERRKSKMKWNVLDFSILLWWVWIQCCCCLCVVLYYIGLAWILYDTFIYVYIVCAFEL